MKVQMTGSYPCIPGTPPTSTLPKALASPALASPRPGFSLSDPPEVILAAIGRMKIPSLPLPGTPAPPPPVTPASSQPVNPAVIALANALRANPVDLSFLRSAPKVHVFSPAVAAQSPLKEKVLDGLRAFSDLITPHCGQKVAIGASVIWLAVDGVSAHSTFRDPASSRMERFAAGSTVGSDVLGLCSGILGGPRLDQAASVLNFAAIIGDHVHTGQITLSQSELVQFSSDPQADDVSNILKLTEILQSPN